MNGKFYLYRHIRLDTGVPFYIGIGTKKFNKCYTIKREYARAYAFGDKDRSIAWRRLFKKINENIEVEIVYESNSYEEIKQKETEFISLYGRRDSGPGLLINLTSGGEGSPNVVISEETREKFKKSNGERLRALNLSRKGKKLSPQHAENIRQALIGRVHSPEAIKKWSEAQKGKKCRPLTQEEKDKRSQFHKGRKRPPSAIEAMKRGWIKRKAKEHVGQLSLL